MAADPNGTTIYFAGLFDRVAGVRRSNFAAVDGRSGHPTGFAPNPDATMHGDSVSAFAVTSAHVYTWGYYGHIGGKPAPKSTAQLDSHSGRLLSGSPATGGGPYSTAVVGKRVFLGGVITQLGGAHRDDLASFYDRSAAVDAWAPTTGPQEVVESLAPIGSLVLTALAHDHWSNGQRLIVGYDASRGKRVWQAHITLDDGVESIAASPDLVVVGGYFALSRPG